MTIQHVNCRLLGHAWDYTTAWRKGRDFVQGLQCMRCGTDRRVTITSQGVRKGNSYTYPADYKVPGGLSPKQRAALRLTAFREHLEMKEME